MSLRGIRFILYICHKEDVNFRTRLYAQKFLPYSHCDYNAVPLINFRIRHMLHLERRRVMSAREGKLLLALYKYPIEIECVVKPSRGFPDNSTCTIVRIRNRFIETQSPSDLTDRPLGLSAIQANSVLPRGGDGCLCVARQSLPHLLLLSFPQSIPLLAMRRDNWERSGWTTLSRSSWRSVLFFRASSTSQSDTPSHSAHFSPPLCQCITDVDEQKRFARLRR